MKGCRRGFQLGLSAPGALALGLLLQHQAVVAAGERDDAAAAAKSGGSLADMDLQELARVRVSPFDVATYLDRGYRASNAVSGSRFDAPIRDLPFAIQAFTESFIKDQKPVNLFDIARYSPGVTYRSNDFNEGDANLAIRGFAVSSTPGNTQVLRDGFNGPSIFDFTNISRVEVVKGPASFLYGQVAPGGIVNIITKSPKRRFAATADATYGSYDEYRVDADITGPATETLFYRLAASYGRDMHYWEPYDAHSQDVAPSLLWEPNDRFSLSLKYEDYRKIEKPQLMQKPGYNPQTGVFPTASDPNRSGDDVPGLPDDWNGMSYADFRDSYARTFNTWADLRLDNHWDLRIGYSHLAYQVDALFTGNFGMANNTTFLQGRRVRGQTYTNRGNAYETRALGQYRFGTTSLRLLLGAQYAERRFDNWAAQAPNNPALGNDPTASPLPLWDLRDPSTWDRTATVPSSALTDNVTDYSVAYRDKSVYGGSTFGFLDDRLRVLLGWRLTSSSNRLHNAVTGQAEPTLSARRVTPQYGVLYKLTPEVSLFASYAESFVPGSQILRKPDGTTAPARPTEGRGHDIGIKFDLFDGRVSGTFTVFDISNRNIVNDLAHTDASGSVVIYNVQSGEQRSRGVELDVTASLRENWQMYLSYSYMDARITEFSGHDAAILSQDPSTLDAAGQQNYRDVRRLHNAPLQMSAPHLANLWTRFDFKRHGLRGAYVAGGVNFVYDQTLLPDGPKSAHQTYALVNAKAGYRWRWHGRRMNLDLMGKNLTDAHYRPSQSTRGRPRELLLTFSTDF